MTEGSGTAVTNPFEAFGSEAAVHQLVSVFYQKMDELPECKTIRDMHKGDLQPMVDKLATFLIGWMGGPRRYQEKFGSVVIPAAHKPFAIGEAERDQWLLCMQLALAESSLEEKWQKALMDAFLPMAEMCRTDQPD